MARLENLPHEALRSIATQLADRASTPRRTLSRERPAVLAESLPIYALDGVPGPEAELASVVRRTPYWHHQIRSGGAAVQFARSIQGEGEWKVVEIAGSGLESALDEAIDLVDREYPGDEWEVRLLTAPAYYVSAIWLHRGDRDELMIVSAPPSLGLRPLGIYPAQRFLAELSEHGPARGVPLIDEE